MLLVETAPASQASCPPEGLLRVFPLAVTLTRSVHTTGWTTSGGSTLTIGETGGTSLLGALEAVSANDVGASTVEPAMTTSTMAPPDVNTDAATFSGYTGAAVLTYTSAPFRR